MKFPVVIQINKALIGPSLVFCASQDHLDEQVAYCQAEGTDVIQYTIFEYYITVTKTTVWQEIEL